MFVEREVRRPHSLEIHSFNFKLRCRFPGGLCYNKCPEVTCLYWPAVEDGVRVNLPSFAAAGR